MFNTLALLVKFAQGCTCNLMVGSMATPTVCFERPFPDFPPWVLDKPTVGDVKGWMATQAHIHILITEDG